MIAIFQGGIRGKKHPFSPKHDKHHGVLSQGPIKVNAARGHEKGTHNPSSFQRCLFPFLDSTMLQIPSPPPSPDPPPSPILAPLLLHHPKRRKKIFQVASKFPIMLAIGDVIKTTWGLSQWHSVKCEGTTDAI